MPGEIYYKFQDKGMNDDDLIDVYLNSETVSGQEQIHCKMALKRFYASLKTLDSSLHLQKFLPIKNDKGLANQEKYYTKLGK